MTRKPPMKFNIHLGAGPKRRVKRAAIFSLRTVVILQCNTGFFKTLLDWELYFVTLATKNIGLLCNADALFLRPGPK
jgi:hypothetical protein